MSKFIEGIRNYLEVRKIKQNYISLVTGWNKGKVSKILSGSTKLSQVDAEHLAEALGHNVAYFMEESDDKFQEQLGDSQMAFFAGTIGEDDKKAADKLVEMFRFYDSLTMINM